MSEPQQQEPKKIYRRKKREEFAFGISLGEWATAVTVGVVGGLFTAAATIRKHFSEELKKWPIFEEDHGAHKKALETENQIYMNAPVKDWRAHRNATKDLKNTYAEVRDAKLFEKTGIHSRGFWKGKIYGSYQRLGFLGKNTTSETIRNAILGIIVSSGALISFFNGVASRDKIEKIEDGVQDLGAGLLDKEGAAALANQIIAHNHSAPTNTVTYATHDARVEKPLSAALSQS